MFSFSQKCRYVVLHQIKHYFVYFKLANGLPSVLRAIVATSLVARTRYDKIPTRSRTANNIEALSTPKLRVSKIRQRLYGELAYYMCHVVSIVTIFVTQWVSSWLRPKRCRFDLSQLALSVKKKPGLGVVVLVLIPMHDSGSLVWDQGYVCVCWVSCNVINIVANCIKLPILSFNFNCFCVPSAIKMSSR